MSQMFPGVSPPCVPGLSSSSHFSVWGPHRHFPHNTPTTQFPTEEMRYSISWTVSRDGLMPSWMERGAQPLWSVLKAFQRCKGLYPETQVPSALGGHTVSKCGFSSFVCGQLFCDTQTGQC